MSLKKFIQDIMSSLGCKKGQLAKQIAAAQRIVGNVSSILANPVTQLALEAVLPKEVMAKYPQALQVLDTVITDLAIGSAIERDIALAGNTEAKLRVFIADLQKYGVTRRNMFLQKLQALIVAGLDDKKLKEAVYDLYSQAEYTLSKQP